MPLAWLFADVAPRPRLQDKFPEGMHFCVRLLQSHTTIVGNLMLKSYTQVALKPRPKSESAAQMRAAQYDLMKELGGAPPACEHCSGPLLRHLMSVTDGREPATTVRVRRATLQRPTNRLGDDALMAALCATQATAHRESRCVAPSVNHFAAGHTPEEAEEYAPHDGRCL